MTAPINDERPTPRSRRPRPAPDADRDPIDPPADEPALDAGRDPMDTEDTPKPPPPAKPAPARATPHRGAGSRSRRVKVSATPDIGSRAVVQLGVRVSTEVDAHLEEIVAATGRTRRELVELAIMALEVSS